MKSILEKFVHILIMPCSKVPTLLEQKGADEVSLLKSIQLWLHLRCCKWCSSYANKMKIVDRILSKKASEQKKNNDIEEFDLQKLKNNIKNKLNN